MSGERGEGSGKDGACQLIRTEDANELVFGVGEVHARGAKEHTNFVFGDLPSRGHPNAAGARVLQRTPYGEPIQTL